MRDAAERGADSRARHVGYHLIGDGRRAFERACGLRADAATRVREAILAHPAPFYFGALARRLRADARGADRAAALRRRPTIARCVARRGAVLALLPAADAAVAIVHQLVNLVVPASRLPRLDYEHAVPEARSNGRRRPAAAWKRRRRRAALDHLEVQYLANRDPQIRFALLSDLLDSPTEHAAGTQRSSKRPSPAFAR